jgi:hypothetical protein
MDCGGKAATWRDTVIQLMDGTAGEAQAGFMTNRKLQQGDEQDTGA